MSLIETIHLHNVKETQWSGNEEREAKPQSNLHSR
jgi:hypothetical protein